MQVTKAEFHQRLLRAAETNPRLFEQFRAAKTILDAHTDARADEIEQYGTTSKKPRELSVGQWVFKLKKGRPSRHADMLEPISEGPYQIAEILSKWLVSLKTARGDLLNGGRGVPVGWLLPWDCPLMNVELESGGQRPVSDMVESRNQFPEHENQRLAMPSWIQELGPGQVIAIKTSVAKQEPKLVRIGKIVEKHQSEFTLHMMIGQWHGIRVLWKLAFRILLGSTYGST